jgi:hypothetical protein
VIHHSPENKKYRPLLAVSDTVKYMKDMKKTLSYQNWKLQDKQSQALDIDLSGYWTPSGPGLMLVDRKYSLY